MVNVNRRNTLLTELINKKESGVDVEEFKDTHKLEND